MNLLLAALFGFLSLLLIFGIHKELSVFEVSLLNVLCLFAMGYFFNQAKAKS